MDTRARSIVLRGVAVLAGILLAAGTIGPAFTAFNPTKGKVKKIARKQANKAVKKKGPDLFLEEGSEIFRYGQTAMNLGDPDQQLATFGPFTLRLSCNLDGGNARGQVLVTTTAAGSTLTSNDDPSGDPFEPGQSREWASEGSEPPGGATDPPWHGDTAVASAPDGTSIRGHSTVHTNFAGAHCVFAGHVLVQAPA